MAEMASIGSWYSTNETLIQQILIFALLAFSFQITLRAGMFSVAGVGFYAVGSYTAGLLVLDRGWAALPAIVAGLVLTAVVGWILAMMLVRLRSLYLAMATVAFDLMVGVVALNWTGLTGGPLGVVGIPISITTLSLVIAVAVVVGLLVLLERGILGRTLVAVREDEELAQSLSVNVRRYRRFAFVLSALLGSLAGSFHALLFVGVQPTDASFDLIVLALTMVVIGGYGSWTGALLGAILLTWLPAKLTSLGDSWDIVYGALMILVATLIPRGLIGVVGNLVRAIKIRRVRASLAAESPATRPPELVGSSPERTP